MSGGERTRSACLQSAMDQFRSQWWMAHRFGLKQTARLPDMTGEQRQEARQEARDYYWQFGGPTADMEVCRKLLSDTLAAIDRAHVTKGSKMQRLHQLLRERDGDDCWVCDNPIPQGRATIEHKHALANGGTWDLDNLVLAHRECNQSLGRLPMEAKEAVRAVIKGKAA